MCGIAAIFSQKERVSGELLHKAVVELDHRGPDNCNQWVAPHGRIGLGHSRLSIIDLSTGTQPIANETRDLHIVVNGEFYGFEAIRSELEARGHLFGTKSDSEIALHLYEDLGTSCLSRLRGEFAFILWDERNQQLFAARDRFGIKPLFYAKKGNQLYLASEIKALFAAGVEASWDEEMVFQVHAGMTMHPGRTLLKNISQVPPGHFLLATEYNIQTKAYWDFNYPEVSAKPVVDIDTAIAQLREKLVESVKIRLRADVPVGCYLSGGLDSCAVLGIASAHLDHPVQAFTLTFDNPMYDEGTVAREMAQKAGATFYPIPVTDRDLADNFVAALRSAEMPFFNAHGIAKFLLSKAVRKAGYRVVLTGEGSDEIFGGYAHFRRDMLLYNNQGQDAATVQRLLGELEANNPVSKGILLTSSESKHIRGVKARLGFVPSFMESNALVGESLRNFFTEEMHEKYQARDIFSVFLNEMDVSRQLHRREPVHQSLYLWSKIALPNYLLTVLGDRMEMANSVEGRLPFLDHELVELVVQMPVHYKIRGMTEKFLLKEAARPFLTETVYQRQKHPFLAPPTTGALGGPLYGLMQDILRSDKLKAVPFYDSKKILSLLDEMPRMSDADRASLDAALMIMLSFVVLNDEFL